MGVDNISALTVEISTPAQRIQNDLETAAAATCRTYTSFETTGRRMCRSTRVLPNWYRDPQVQVLHDRASVYDGWCLA